MPSIGERIEDYDELDYRLCQDCKPTRFIFSMATLNLRRAVDCICVSVACRERIVNRVHYRSLCVDGTCSYTAFSCALVASCFHCLLRA